jgi:hypothetical protein
MQEEARDVIFGGIPKDSHRGRFFDFYFSGEW